MTMSAAGRISASEKFDAVFVLPHMGRGGAQRVVSLVANAWAREGRRVCVLTWLAGRPDEHTLELGVVRLTSDDFITWDNRSRFARARGEIRSRLRRLERWLRPRWPWRARLAAAIEDDGVIASSAHVSMSWNSLSMRARTRAARILVGVDSKIRDLWGPRHASVAKHRGRALEALAGLAVRYRIGVRWILPKLVLDRRVDAIRDALIKLDAHVVVSFLTRTNVYVLEAARGMPCRVVVSERNDLDLQRIDPTLDALRRYNYWRAHAVTANTRGTLAQMADFVPDEKLRLLPNPIVVPAMPRQGGVRGKSFVTMARLVPQKGVDVLLRAFASVADELPDWSLEIVGDGPLRADLEALAATLGVAGRVRFHGYLKQPFGVLQSSRVFVLSSRFEGMPNSLLEAMGSGLAPIVTDASPGPLDCVINNETGLVVATDDIVQLADAMRRLATDDPLVERLARQAANFVREHDWAVVEAQWIDVLGLEPHEKQVHHQVGLDRAS